MYTQSDIESRMNSRIQNKIGMLVDPLKTVNDGIRELNRRLFMESRIRRVMLTPSLITGRYDYVLPTDFSARNLIDVPTIGTRRHGSLEIISPVEFATRPRFGSIAFDRYNGIKLIKIYGSNTSSSVILSNLNSLTIDGGTWESSGDGSNVRVDENNFPYKNPVIAFDIAATGETTAGIKNTALNAVDFSNFVNSDCFIVLDAYLNTDIDIDSVTLKFGSDASNYYTANVTKQFDGSDFASGENKLYFTTITKVGTPVVTAIDYCEIVLDIDTAHTTALNFAFSKLEFHRGVPTPIIYYTKYNWRGVDGTLRTDATLVTDISLCDEDEFNMHVDSAVIQAMRELSYPENIIINEETRLVGAMREYQLANPADVVPYTTLYQDFTGDGMHTNNVDNGRSYVD